MPLQEVLILRGAPCDKSCVQGAKAAKCFVIPLGAATLVHIPDSAVNGFESINSLLRKKKGCVPASVRLLNTEAVRMRPILHWVGTTDWV